jgi:hypothetical protein
VCDVLPEVERPEPFLKGDKLIVVGHSPFSGHRGTYERLVDDTTALVWFDWMGRMVQVDVDLRDVERFEERQHHRARRYNRGRRGRAKRLQAIADRVQ